MKLFPLGLDGNQMEAGLLLANLQSRSWRQPPFPAQVGRLLRLLREAQAVGAVTTREAALDYIRRMRDRPLDTSELAP